MDHRYNAVKGMLEKRCIFVEYAVNTSLSFMTMFRKFFVTSCVLTKYIRFMCFTDRQQNTIIRLCKM